ncbi:hypothetical protein ACN27F_23365 [Solwaraspora sp. WMMB335]|uniref:hypothetical protein n=1 Tax=Solwaraspora sp. WMMB335 TaxID=3404118 RepID=UPI003B95CEB1
MASTMHQGRQGRASSIAVLVVAAAVLAATAFGLGSAVTGTLRDDEDRETTADPSGITAAGDPATETATDSAPDGVQTRADALAAEPMLELPESAAYPQPVVTEKAGPPIRIPPPQVTIVVGGPPVPTGFPRTPEGALAQLAAIDQVAMSTVDMTRVHEVYDWAALPGAIPEQEWVPWLAVGAFRQELGEAELAVARLEFTVVQGQIKGTVGADLVLACVLGEASLTIVSVGQGAIGRCERMVWSGDRWWIGPGAAPADAPQAWPGSADAVRGGWRDLVVGD